MSGAAVDDLRRGLSFAEEACLMVSLSLGTSLASQRQRPRLRSATVAALARPQAERRSLRRAMHADLAEVPIRTEVHPEWRSEDSNVMPRPLREQWLQAAKQPVSTRRAAWLVARWPVVSARLGRAQQHEAACLSTLPLEVQQRVTRRAAETGIALAFRDLNPRRRLTVTRAFSTVVRERIERSPVGELEISQDVRRATVAKLGALIARAAGGARSPDHLFDRFSSALLALCFGPPYHYEARAIARSQPIRSGRRLMRYLDRSAATDRLAEGVQGVAQQLLLAALNAHD